MANGLNRIKPHLIGAGFAAFRATGLHEWLAPRTRGKGAILTLHRVRPAGQRGGFMPNALLEITPDFLDAALTRIRALGFDLVTLEEMLRRLGDPDAAPAVALTFDDGYRDLADHALPILRRHAAPFSAFVTSGFAERTARLWWLELEEIVHRADRLTVTIDGETHRLFCRSIAEKRCCYSRLYWRLRAGSEDRLLSVLAGLTGEAGIVSRKLVEDNCLDWDGIRALAADPSCTIGAHTCSHPMLAKHPSDVARHEMDEGRRRIAQECGAAPRFLSYPVGDPTSAGPREFTLAAELGFAAGVTTRPGMLFADHAAAPHALPRISLTGEWQRLDCLEVLLSGAPFAFLKGGRPSLRHLSARS